MKHAALALTRMGFVVFPVHGIDTHGKCTCGKAACDRPGKHPCIVGWNHRSAATAEEIQNWFRKWPDMNLGLLTGTASGIIALDVDKHRLDGESVLASLLGDARALPKTPYSRTGGGGFHHVFLAPEVVPKTVTDLLPGVDLMAEGGFIIVPPSRHSSGRRYKWAVHPRELEPAKAPERLITLAHLNKEVRNVIGEHVLEHGDIANGSRNDQLTRVAGRLWNLAGVRTGEQLEGALGCVNQVLCAEPLEAPEIHTIATSVASYEKHERPAASERVHHKLRMEPLVLASADSGPADKLPWIIPGWLTEEDIVLVCGRVESGKSTMLASMAHALPRAVTWCGLHVDRPRRVLVLDEEQPKCLTRRMYLRTGRAYGDDSEQPGLRIYSSQGLDLNTSHGVEALEEVLEEHRPAAVVMDSLSKLFPGVNEDQAHQVTPIFVKLRQLQGKYRCAFMLVHHPRKKSHANANALDAVRGSGVYAAQADTVWVSVRKGTVMELRQA